MSTEPNFEIVRLGVEDAARYAIVRLKMLRDHPESFGSSPSEIEDADDAALRKRFEDRHSGEADFILAAEICGVIVGTCGLYRIASKKSEHLAGIWGVWTAPEHRGRGVARALIEETIRRARRIPGLLHLRIGHSAVNEGAGRLYRSLGFQPWGIEPAAMRVEIDGVVKSLDEHHLSLDLRAEP